MKTSLEIAQEAQLIPIDKIAEQNGLKPDEVEPYGRYKAKVSLGVLERLNHVPDAKLVCVHNPVGGDRIGSARWLGVPLARVLDMEAPTSAIVFCLTL